MNSKSLHVYRIGDVDVSLNDMLDIGVSIHDHIWNENGSLSKISK